MKRQVIFLCVNIVCMQAALYAGEKNCTYYGALYDPFLNDYEPGARQPSAPLAIEMDVLDTKEADSQNKSFKKSHLWNEVMSNIDPADGKAVEAQQRLFYKNLLTDILPICPQGEPIWRGGKPVKLVQSYKIVLSNCRLGINYVKILKNRGAKALYGLYVPRIKPGEIVGLPHCKDAAYGKLLRRLVDFTSFQGARREIFVRGYTNIIWFCASGAAVGTAIVCVNQITSDDSDDVMRHFGRKLFGYIALEAGISTGLNYAICCIGGAMKRRDQRRTDRYIIDHTEPADGYDVLYSPIAGLAQDYACSVLKKTVEKSEMNCLGRSLCAILSTFKAPLQGVSKLDRITSYLDGSYERLRKKSQGQNVVFAERYAAKSVCDKYKAMVNGLPELQTESAKALFERFSNGKTDFNQRTKTALALSMENINCSLMAAVPLQLDRCAQGSYNN